MHEMTAQEITRAADQVERDATTLRQLGYAPADPIQVDGQPHVAGPINAELRRRYEERAAEVDA